MIHSIFGYFTTPAIPNAPPIPDLNKKVVLTLENEIKQFKFKPALGRNKPKIDKDNEYNMIRLTDLLFKELLNVKLKHVDIPDRNNKWEFRHPVLKELAAKAILIH